MRTINQWLRVTATLIGLVGLSGCSNTGIPEGLEPVENFELDRYLGRWYEIARLDHDFERGLERVSATYTRREDGGVRVINTGYDPDKGEWDVAEGRAYFIGAPDVGRLKVSFFGPFYGGYNIIDLDPGYQYVMVVGPSRDYFWILTRTPELGRKALEELLEKARELGFETDRLIFPRH